MADLLYLYKYAEKHHIDVDWFSLPVTPSLSVKLPDNSCAIGIDPWKMETIAEETVCLAHELGHCETDSFYDPTTGLPVKQKCENRADRWAIQRLVPRREFFRAVESGCTEVWQLADYFNVTEEFMRKAMCYYTNGNLSYNLYS